MVKLVALLCFALLSARLAVADLEVGASTATVLEQFGEPSARAQRGEQLVFVYPQGGRVEFLEGKVVSLQPPFPAPRSNAPPPRTVSSSPSVSATNTHAFAAGPPATFAGLVAAAFVQFLIFAAALKAALTFWRSDALWRAVFLIAAIDVTLRVGLALVLPASRGFSAREVLLIGIPALVLVGTVCAFTFNRRIAPAVLTAASAKLLVVFCNVFIRLALPTLLIE